MQLRGNCSRGTSEGYRRDGYLTFATDLPDSVLDAAIQQTAPLLASAGRVQDAWATCPAVRSVARWPVVLRKLKQLYGMEPKPFQSLNFRFGTEQPAHADVIHFNSDPSGWVCGVWVALEDVHPDAGPLIYYPGTHLWAEETTQSLGLEPGAYTQYEQAMRRRVADRKSVLGTMRKGQGIIWAGNLLHGGSPIKDPRRTRWSQVTHYFFPGCRYCTPLLSSPERRQWRSPRWI